MIPAIAPTAVALSDFLFLYHARNSEHQILWIELTRFGRHTNHLLNF